jgi:hypothetical protein
MLLSKLYVLTRFYFVRKLYGVFRRRFNNSQSVESAASSVLLGSDDYDLGFHANQVASESWTLTPKLTPEFIAAITQYAKTTKGRRPSYPKNEIIFYEDVKREAVSESNKTLMLRVDPSESLEIQRLCSDRLLISLAEAYLGYKVRSVEAQLLWSFGNIDVDMKERHTKAQAVYYHWDSMAVNGFRVNFYLTDVDENSGAHVLIPKSHRRRPWKYIWARSTTTDSEALIRYYGGERLIDGAAGTGFAQDVNGFHRALAPKSSDRLHLHFRYT